MNKVFTLLLVSCYFIGFTQNPTSFSCSGSDGFGYYVSSANFSIMNNNLVYADSRLSKITTATGTRTTLCSSAEMGVALNGLAFNPHDNFLYAVTRYDSTEFSGKLYRIGENCEKMEIPVTGSFITFSTNNTNTIDAAGGNISSATFDLDNNYYVNTSFTNASSSGFTNKMQKISIENNMGVVQSTVTLTCPSCAGTKLRVTDIIFEEATGQLYGSNKETDKLYIIDPSSGILTEAGSTGITTAILGMYKNKDGKVRAIGQNGNIYNVNIISGSFNLLSTVATLNSGNADGASGCYAPPKINGYLYADANGLTDNTVNGVGTNAAGATTLYANLIQNGLVVKSDLLQSNGFYQFLGLFSGTYEVQISSTLGVVGQAAPSQNLPATHMFTGDHIGNNAGDDGTPDGILSMTIAMGVDIVDANFGINGIPISEDLMASSQMNPGTLNQVTVPTLVFSDPEEPGINNITIATIPNPITQGILYYNGMAVLANQYIPNYNASLLTVDPIDGDVTVVFTYFTTDMANVNSNISTVNLPFTFPALPVVLSSFTGESKGYQNEIRWITESEDNCELFSLEKKSQFGDFEEIAIIFSKGNSDREQEYVFVDKNVLTNGYYRLKMVDYDGSFEYSYTINLRSKKEMDVSMYPSRVQDNLYVEQMEGAPRQSYMILNANGIRISEGALQEGINTFHLDDLPSGTYFFIIRNNKDYSSKKFIKI